MKNQPSNLSIAELERVVVLANSLIASLWHPVGPTSTLMCAAKTLGNFFHAGNCAIFRVCKPEISVMELVADHNRWWTAISTPIIKRPSCGGIGDGITSWSASAGPQRLNHKQITDFGFKTVGKAHLGGYDLFSYMSIPLFGPLDDLVGLLKFENKLDSHDVPSAAFEFSCQDMEMATILSKPTLAVMMLYDKIWHTNDDRLQNLIEMHLLGPATGEDTLKRVIDLACNIHSALRGDLAWWVAQEKDLVFAAQYGEANNLHPGKNRPVPIDGAIRYAFETSGSDHVSIPDTETTTLPYVCADTRVKSEIALRVDLNGNPVGVLNLEFDKISHFTDVELRGLRTLGSHAALAVQRAQRERLMERALRHRGEPREILQPILEGVLEAFGFDGGILYRHDVATNCLRVAASQQPDATPDDDAAFFQELTKPSWAKVAFELTDLSHPIICTDPENDPRVSKEGLRKWKIRSKLLGYPIRVENQSLGCLILWTSKRPFPQVKPSARRLEEFTRLAAAKLLLHDTLKALEEKEAFFELLANASPIWMLTKCVTQWKPDEQRPPYVREGDPKIVYDFANQNFCQYLGKTAADILGNSDWHYFPADAAEYYKGDLDTLAGNPPVGKEEKNRCPSTGKLHHIRVWKLLLPGERQRIQVIFFDRTDEHELEVEHADLLKLKETLLDDLVHRVTGAFFYINSVIGDEMKRAAPEQLHILSECRLRIEFFEKLIRYLYRRGPGKDVAMRPFILEVLKFVSESFKPKGEQPIVKLRDCLSDGDFPERAALYCGLIVTEVVANAYEHAFGGIDAPEIEVRLERAEDGRWILMIADNGIGIRGALPAQAFAVGLNLVDRLVQHLHGQNRLEDFNPAINPPGTRFVAAFDPRASGTASLAPPPADRLQPSVLIVEDVPLYGDYCTRVLQDAGNHILGVVSTPDEALEAIQRFKPNVLVLDIRLGDTPELREAGADILKRARAIIPDLPVVVLTAYGDSSVIDEFALQHNVSTLIKSSYMDDNLRLLVRQALQKRIGGRKIFICYSHRDRSHFEELNDHLVCFNQADLEIWHDQKIPVGENWRDKIDIALKQSVVAVVLVSAKLNSSRFVQEFELPRLIEQARGRATKICPIKILSCTSRFDQFEYIAGTATRPIGDVKDEAERAKIWDSVRAEIQSVIEELPS